MSLVAHAKHELELAGLFNKDSDYGGLLGESTMKLIEVFASEGHSGMSAQLQVEIFTLLASWKPLTPLTNDPAEWMDLTGVSQDPMFQNRRDPACFSNDGGKTYYSVDDKERVIKTAVEKKP